MGMNNLRYDSDFQNYENKQQKENIQSETASDHQILTGKGILYKSGTATVYECTQII